MLQHPFLYHFMTTDRKCQKRNMFRNLKRQIIFRTYSTLQCLFILHYETTYMKCDRGESICTLTEPRNKNFHPLRLARTARSISSTVVLSFQPPASSIAAILQTPAVPVDTTFTFQILRWTTTNSHGTYRVQHFSWTTSCCFN